MPEKSTIGKRKLLHYITVNTIQNFVSPYTSFCFTKDIFGWEIKKGMFSA
jgi:hypothetical protein